MWHHLTTNTHLWGKCQINTDIKTGDLRGFTMARIPFVTHNSRRLLLLLPAAKLLHGRGPLRSCPHSKPRSPRCFWNIRYFIRVPFLENVNYLLQRFKQKTIIKKPSSELLSHSSGSLLCLVVRPKWVRAQITSWLARSRDVCHL